MRPEINIALCRTVPAAVIKSGIQRAFVNRLKRARGHVRNVVMVSPWITGAGKRDSSFEILLQTIRGRPYPVYVITREPELAGHLSAVDRLKGMGNVELIYNNNVHAKIFVCRAEAPYSFGLIGSANFTTNSANMYEIGVLIVGVGGGMTIVDDLAQFGFNHLRTRPESEVIQKIDPRSLRNVIR